MDGISIYFFKSYEQLVRILKMRVLIAQWLQYAKYFVIADIYILPIIASFWLQSDF